MPRVECDWGDLYYEAEGSGETVCFLGDLGYGAWQWAWQHGAVAGPYEALAHDHRGTGRSDCPPGPYALADLAADLEAVLSAHDARRAHLVGAGLGGLVALAYAREYGRARSLALIGSSAGGPHLPERPVERLFAPTDDPDALRATLAPVLSERFRTEHADIVDGIVAWRASRTPGDAADATGDAGDATPEGWRAQAAALEGTDLRDALVEVAAPALVVHGTEDAVWPVAGGEALAEGLPRGRYEPVTGAPHLVGVERCRTVNDLLVGFLEERTGE
jgi:pimeloyl-ACP methyl ester carboxylesterase